jgi:predicted permease
VILEVALSLMLLVGAGLFVRSLRHAQALDPGFDAERLVTAPLNVNLLRYTTEQGRQFYRQAIERMESLPGVEAASVARIGAIPGGGRTMSFQIEGQETAASSSAAPAVPAPLMTSANVVSPGYFRTLGIRVTGGRDFDARDAPDSTPVVLVNEAFARRHFPHTSPLGQRIGFNGPQGPWREIVGTVGDSAYARLGEVTRPIAYLPLAQNHETGMVLFVRTSGDPGDVLGSLRQALQALEPNLPLSSIRPVSEVVNASLAPARLGAWFVGVFGALALVLASIGVYSVLAFSISRRTREFGIRLALGANARDVFRLVVGEGLSLVVIGLTIGLAGAAAGARSVAALLYGIGPLDPSAFSIAAAALLIVSLAACLVPAGRATRVDPAGALKR